MGGGFFSSSSANWTGWGKQPKAGKGTIGTQKAGAIGGRGKERGFGGWRSTVDLLVGTSG